MRPVLVRSLGLALLTVAPGVAAAQTAHIVGRAHALGDSARAVLGAEVTLFPGARMIRSDSTGSFVFTEVANGVYRVRVRQLGFSAREMRVIVADARDQVVDVPMTASAQAMVEVVVAGKRRLVPARLADAYGRLARGSGDYFTRERMDSLHALDMKTVLGLVPGVHTSDHGYTFGRCNPGTNPFASPKQNASEKVHVYIDGVRLTNYQEGANVNVEDVLKDIRPNMLELVEVYRGVSRLPGEYLDDACAVILLWTK